MAKTQKYSEDLLLDAVIKFSEIEKKKIKATELAKWSRDNIEGLEEVRDYHFTRPVKKKDDKTGKMIEKPKLCTLKIEEINKSRSLTVGINTNLLLRASNIDTFMEQSDIIKRKMIIETREIVDKLLIRNTNITKENEALKVEIKTMKSDVLMVIDRINDLQKVQDKLVRQIKYLMKVTDEAARKEMLLQMGIEDGAVNLTAYIDSLQKDLSEIMDINKTLRKYLSEEDDEFVTEANKNFYVENIMSGLDFKK